MIALYHSWLAGRPRFSRAQCSRRPRLSTLFSKLFQSIFRNTSHTSRESDFTEKSFNDLSRSAGIQNLTSTPATYTTNRRGAYTLMPLEETHSKTLSADRTRPASLPAKRSMAMEASITNSPFSVKPTPLSGKEFGRLYIQVPRASTYFTCKLHEILLQNRNSLPPPRDPKGLSGLNTPFS